jgi:8-oxo-dGTP pyrophosphatase MutT (NUDIX family)
MAKACGPTSCRREGSADEAPTKGGWGSVRVIAEGNRHAGCPHGAAAIIFDEDSRVLLIREGYGAHRYGPPGGAVEPGETPRAAAARETREECGIEVDVGDMIGRVYGGRTDSSRWPSPPGS